MSPNVVPEKKSEIIDGFTIKYHTNGQTSLTKGRIMDGKADGYWEWFRLDGTIKRSGWFEKGNLVGEWITCDKSVNIYKVERKS